MEFEYEKKEESSNATIEDLVYWFLQKEPMSHKKIQKLSYYAQAWSYTLRQIDIVDEIEFEAWVHGPVNKVIWDMLKKSGWRNINIPFDENMQVHKFNDSELDVLNLVWDNYGEFSADTLEGITHEEKPWLDARKGCGKFDPSCNKISRESMADFYVNLYE